METQCAGRRLRLVIDGGHHGRNVETRVERADRVREDSEGRISERHGAKRDREKEARIGENHGSAAIAGVDMPAEHHAADCARYGSDRQSTPVGKKVLAQRNEKRNLPDEIVTGADKSIRDEEKQTRKRCLEGA